jgi:hypothetical protein
VHLRLVAALLDARLDPRRAELRQPVVRVAALRPRRVVDVERRLAAREVDAANRDAETALLDIDLLGGRKALDGRDINGLDGRQLLGQLASLRRHYPGQVRGVARTRVPLSSKAPPVCGLADPTSAYG